LDVEGLDAIFIGPYDLSASMGLTAQFDHPHFCATIDKIKILSASKSIPVGIHVVAPEPDQLQQSIVAGYQFLAYSVDAVMLQSAACIELSE